ncbi:MAG: response regulator [Candidatus Aminicenantes bacterium]
MREENIILLAEDNSDDIELIRRLFKKKRIRNKLVVIQDGEEVLEYLYRRGPYEGRRYSLPSLILLDLTLPKMGALEVLEKIQADEQAFSIPVIILISHEGERNLIKEAGLRVDGFIQKPLDLVKLEKAVKEMDFSLVMEAGKRKGL